MSEPTHKCPNYKSTNVIFYSGLWKSWVLKIIPAKYDQMMEAYKDAPTSVKANLPHPVMIEIDNCPYCGVKL